MSKKIWTYIIGILLTLFGIFLIIKPDQTFEHLIYYVGIALVVTGIIKIVSYIINRSDNLFKNYLTNGILNIVLGILFINNTSTTLNFISTFLGMWLIFSSISSLLFTYRINIGYYNITLQLIKFILGIVVVTTPIITYIFTGIFLGIIFIAIGIGTIVKEEANKNVYKVRVKK